MKTDWPIVAVWLLAPALCLGVWAGLVYVVLSAFGGAS